MRQVNVGYLLREGEVLLAMKKRGFGAGKWNGFGGKLKPGETLEECFVREAQEELSIKPTKFEKRAVLEFQFDDIPAEEGWNQQMHVYLCHEWEGEPCESEEMAPQWFPLSELPREMWSSDKCWLERVLNGEKVAGKCVFAGRGEVVKEFVERPFTT